MIPLMLLGFLSPALAFVVVAAGPAGAAGRRGGGGGERGAQERVPVEAADAKDSDGDGLSDFDEVHKHRTDPREADSDGDEVPDGDWLERREHT